MGIALKYWRGLERPFLGVEHEEKEKQTFSSTFWEEALLPDGFLRDIDSRNHASNPFVLKEIEPPYPSLHGALRVIHRQTELLTDN